MKKSLVILACLWAGFSAFAAIDEKYASGYELRSLEINTLTNESSISILPNQEMLFLNDGKVFVSSIDSAKENLSSPVEHPAFTQMGIHGTVAADTTHHKIYFSLVESKNCEWLYSSTFQDGNWSTPERLVIIGMEEGRAGGNFLSNAGWSYYTRVKHLFQNPTISANGKRLYFTSSTIAGGQGGKDLWSMDLQEDGRWSHPTNLGTSINTSADEDFAFIEEDGQLYYSSNQSGIRHLYVAQPADGWKQSEMMAAPYNSAFADYSIVITEGTPFLITDRNVGNGSDIYAFAKLPVEIIPEDTVEVPVKTYEAKKREFYWVFFLYEFDKDILAANFDQEVDSLAREMQKFPDAIFEVAGYTDSRGSEAYNDRLSERRAKDIVQLLEEKGIPADHMKAVGYGERRLQVPNAQTEEEHAQNRRVEVRILNVEDSPKVVEVPSTTINPTTK